MCGILNVFLTTCIRMNKMAIRKGNPGIGNMKEMMDQIKAGGMMKKGYAKGKMVKKMQAGGGVKPDFLDIDKDGDKTESMKAASGKKAGGMMKKSYAKGVMTKKMMAKGGKAKGKTKGGKSKVRGAGIARKGVRSAKMR